MTRPTLSGSRRLLALGGLLALMAGPGAGLGSGPAAAIDAKGRYDVYGSGLVRCNEWTNQRNKRSSMSDRDKEWVAGYVTAYNRWVHKGKSIWPSIDPESIYQRIDAYCLENPLDSLSGAAESLILEQVSR